ncbi:MAG: DEAD/DEAH box helicase [archaeon]
MKLFENMGLSNELLGAIQKLGFSKPTQIQEMSIQDIVKGKDVIGESSTGSGKTLAFGCGVIQQVIPGKGLQALILTPTRELAEQVKEELKRLSFQKHLKMIAVYGGVSISPQIHDLMRSEVVVATPGRLLDHYRRRTIDLSKVKLLVLDEADRMLDMGFIDEVEHIIRSCPKQRQTLFFSATISARIQTLANRYMNNPIKVTAEKQVDPSKLKQVYYNIINNMKLSLLTHLLENEKSGLVMVFCNTRRTTDFVVKNLCANKIDATAIHGGLSQNKRSRTIDMFNGAKVSVLVCTDVAARGLHIENVSHVYNYEIPKDPKDYVHRIGRTARAGENGKVVNLLSNSDHDNFSRVKSEYRTFTISMVEKPFLKTVVAVRADNSDYQRGNNRGFSRGNSRGYSRGGNGNSRGYGRSNDRSNDSQGNSRGYGRSNNLINDSQGNSRGYGRSNNLSNDSQGNSRGYGRSNNLSNDSQSNSRGYGRSNDRSNNESAKRTGNNYKGRPKYFR